MADNKKKSLGGQIRIPEDLKREIERESTDLDLYEYEVVERAWRAYVTARDGKVPAPQCPFGDATSAEQRILRGVLAYLRESADMPDRKPFVEMLEALGKRYAKR